VHKPDLKQSSLRSVALLEGAKGLLVLFATLALFRYIHADWQAMADRIVRHFHLDPTGKYPHILLTMAANITQPKILALGAGAIAYVAIRFAEAYGLWHNRRWAIILGIVSSGIYLPFEINELIARQSLLSALILTLNIVVIIVLWLGRPKKL
jgi:uncharacterized membrane protein (DUF2068 family)